MLTISSELNQPRLDHIILQIFAPFQHATRSTKINICNASCMAFDNRKMHTRQNVNYTSGISHAIIKMNLGFRIFCCHRITAQGAVCLLSVMNEQEVYSI